MCQPMTCAKWDVGSYPLPSLWFLDRITPKSSEAYVPGESTSWRFRACVCNHSRTIRCHDPSQASECESPNLNDRLNQMFLD
jgi:hypothetical protein